MGVEGTIMLSYAKAATQILLIGEIMLIINFDIL